MRTTVKTGIKNDRRENLHIHWGLKEMLMILAFIATPTIGVINTMIKADNTADDMDDVKIQISEIEDNVDVNTTDLAVSATKIENVDETVKRIESLMIDFIKANGD